MSDTIPFSQANGHTTAHAPDAADPGALDLKYVRDRRGGRVAVVAMRGDEVLAQERVDPFSDREIRKLATDWALRLRQPVDALLPPLRSITAKILAEDAAADAAAAEAPPGPGGQGQALVLSWPPTWPAAVKLADVLDEVVAAIRTYVVLSAEQAAAAALWCCWSYHVDRFDTAPILLVNSPTKRCGKSTLGRVLSCILPRVLSAVSITPAALFRTIEAVQPTLVIDEVDAFLAASEELRGLLNAGHSRDAAYVIRVEGDAHEPRRFNVFGAKLLLGIGRLPATIEDRAIVLTLERKPPGAEVARLTRASRLALEELAAKLMRWAVDHGDAVDGDADPPVPAALNDRQADSWRPLLVLADLAGGQWPALARRAAEMLSAGAADVDNEDLGVRLLADVMGVFSAIAADQLSAKQLAAALAEIEDGPWADYRHGRPISPEQVGHRLKLFGIRPRRTKHARLYDRVTVEAAALKYVPKTPEQTVTPSPVDASDYQVSTYGVTVCKNQTVTPTQTVTQTVTPQVIGTQGTYGDGDGGDGLKGGERGLFNDGTDEWGEV